jgi:hypothetical protein
LAVTLSAPTATSGLKLLPTAHPKHDAHSTDVSSRFTKTLMMQA